jgi:hypothetical protein
MIGCRFFDSVLAKESHASLISQIKKVKKFKKFQRRSKKFKVQKVQCPLPAREYLSVRHHTTRKSEEATIPYDFAAVAAGCSCAPQWKNVVFDISPNGR